jgi:hypothetical protein
MYRSDRVARGRRGHIVSVLPDGLLCCYLDTEVTHVNTWTCFTALALRVACEWHSAAQRHRGAGWAAPRTRATALLCGASESGLWCGPCKM